MDVLLQLLKQKPRDNWQWTLEPNVRSWNRGNALALANCSLLAYSDPGEIDAQLKNRGFQAVTQCNFQHHITDTQAYVAVRRDALIIAFRGTEPTNAVDFATDFDARQVAFKSKFHFEGWGQIHEGWADGVNVVLAKIAEALKVHDDGVRPLWITGHSLGGALAMVTAAFLSNVSKNRIAGVFTYGQPRVGDPIFRERYERELGAITYRCVNDCDLVPHVPPRSLSSVERTIVKPGLTGLGDLFDALVHQQDGAERYEHTGQLRLLLPTGELSQNLNDEAAREPEFFRMPRTARSFFLALPAFLLSSPALIKDHAPINPITRDGYVDRIEALA